MTLTEKANVSLPGYNSKDFNIQITDTVSTATKSINIVVQFLGVAVSCQRHSKAELTQALGCQFGIAYGVLQFVHSDVSRIAYHQRDLTLGGTGGRWLATGGQTRCC